jgi:hypothetical protein
LTRRCALCPRRPLLYELVERSKLRHAPPPPPPPPLSPPLSAPSDTYS